MMNIVLDTNCLLMSLSSKGNYFPIWQSLLIGKYTLCFSNDILKEYEEILSSHINSKVAANVISVILNLPNTKQVDVYYHFDLIKADVDDNKFVDCAIKSNAKYIVTEDHHYDILKSVPFPKINVIDIESFVNELKNMSPERYQ